MRKKTFSEEQIALALRDAETGTPVTEVCRKMGVSEQSFYRWKKKYLGMGIAELRRLRQLEEENRKLKGIVADLTLDIIRPGKPIENAYIESFNGRLRQECLNQCWFSSLEDAKIKIEAWRIDYNEHRPHTSLGNRTPEQFESEWQLSRNPKEGIF